MKLEDLIKHIEEYQAWAETEYQNAMKRTLTMIGYDMHSRQIACRHILEWVRGQESIGNEFLEQKKHG